MPEKLPRHYYLLWIISGLSLALNLFVLYILFTVRQQASVAFTQAADALGTIQGGDIEYLVKIDEQVPIALDVPVKFTVTIPIEKTLPINTLVNVPVEIPLIGPRTISIPIQTTIPIKFDVEVPIDETVPVNADIPVHFAVPVRIKIADTPFGEGLGEFQSVLIQQAEGLGDSGAP